MGWLGNIVGIGTPNNSGGFQATGVNQNDINNAQQQAQSGIAQQQNFLNQLNAQNGLQNQSNVYSQLQGVANGTGPNPAQAMLNQSTGQNVSNQAALAASQRGASSNVGLIGRQAADQGANLQQQAVGQAATMQANQSLAALGQMQNLATQQVGQQAGGISNYNQFVQGNQGQLLGGQGNQNTVNSAIAQSNQKAGAGLIGGILGGVGAAQVASGGKVEDDGSITYADGGSVGDTASQISAGFNGAMGFPKPQPAPPKNYAGGGSVQGPQSFAGQFMSTGVAAQPMQQQQDNQGTSQIGQFGGKMALKGYNKLFGSSDADATPQLGGAAGANAGAAGLDTSGSGSAAGAQAGADAGATDAAAEGAAADAGGADAADAILALDDGGYIPQYGSGSPNPQSDPGAISTVLGDITGYLNKGGSLNRGNVKAMLSPGEEYLSPDKAKAVAAGKAHPMSGKKVPGKAEVKGDSLKNDKVPAKLERGGVVVKRSVMNTNDPEQVANFVRAVMAKSSMKRK